MDLEIITLNEVGQTKTNIIDTTNIWNIKSDTKEVYKTLMDIKKKFMAPKRESSVKDKLRVWHKYVYTTAYTTDN